MQATGLNPLLVVVRKVFPNDQPLYDAYYTRYMQVRKEMKDAKPPPQVLTEREAANWKSLSEINDRRVELQRYVNRKILPKSPEELTIGDKVILMRHLILCLFTYQPAIRNDYSECPIVRFDDIKTPDARILMSGPGNYLLEFAKDQFRLILKDFKTAKHHGPTEIDMSTRPVGPRAVADEIQGLSNVGLYAIPVRMFWNKKEGRKDADFPHKYAHITTPELWKHSNDEAMRQVKDANGIAILTRPSRLFVVDIDVSSKDNKKPGIELWNRLIKEYGEPQTLKAQSGSDKSDEKGRKREDDVRTSKAKVDLLNLALRIMNHYFAIVRSTKAVYLETIYWRDANGQLEPEETIHRSGRDFSEVCRNFQLQSLSGKSKEVAKFWESDSRRREYDRIVFEPDPSKGSSRHFNLFSGLKFKPLDCRLTESELVECEEQMPKLMWHLRNILCDGSKERFDYNLCWMAHALQKPWRKIGVALVFRSGQGCGKSVLWDFFGRMILGAIYYLYCNEIEKIIGKFNSLAANRLLIVLDECGSWGGAYRMNDRIKSLITQETTCMERKGQDPISVDDKSNIVFTTNNYWPVKREADDRRYCCQQVSNAKMGNKKYFDELVEELEKPETAYHLHRYLSSIEISNWNPQKMPVTAWGEGLKEHSIPPHVNMMQALLENGCFHPSLETWVASTDIKRTYDTFLLQLDIKEDRHTDVNVLMRSLNAIFNMKPAARSIQGVRTHKGWWFSPQGAICEALHRGKLLSSTVEWVDTWQRLDYTEDEEGPWMTDPKALQELVNASKGSKELRQSAAEQKCSFCSNHHGWVVRRNEEGHIVTRESKKDKPS
ncbi:hypothetical protein KFL_013830020 [Klebsormidium nitens]|uniref:NrS-1 polymerase-like helicase domain-containing protein n=1 Tax=Klebsormidium nitens TaxID=105231 RepID=A0A1Y1IRC6_KLENI|nr:hypothetical protein KFL_013830020 [Klebsormidium nitens]|eukprot:GAQ93243.1 hypothetical protein KFL_013830020 [Klebsormidium nitens]